MYVLVTYDVNTQTPEGRRRLRHVAKKCLDYGQRVQKSVFELKVDPAQWAECKYELLQIINKEEDSLRFYYLGSNWRRRVEHRGARPSLDIDGPLPGTPVAADLGISDVASNSWPTPPR